MDSRVLASKGGYSKDVFDCRRYIKSGDAVTWHVDIKDIDLFSGLNKVVNVYEHFIIIKCEHIILTLNRWEIETVNGHKVSAGGCFCNVPSLFERGIKGDDDYARIYSGIYIKS